MIPPNYELMMFLFIHFISLVLIRARFDLEHHQDVKILAIVMCFICSETVSGYLLLAIILQLIFYSMMTYLTVVYALISFLLNNYHYFYALYYYFTPFSLITCE